MKLLFDVRQKIVLCKNTSKCTNEIKDSLHTDVKNFCYLDLDFQCESVTLQSHLWNWSLAFWNVALIVCFYKFHVMVEMP